MKPLIPFFFLLGCGAATTEPDSCGHTLGTLQVHLELAWGGAYTGATEITVQPEGETAYLVSVAGSDFELELEAGLYSLWMDENAELCLSHDAVEAEIEACGEHTLQLEIDCANR